VTRYLPQEEKHRNYKVTPSIYTCRFAPVIVSQSRTVPSLDPDATSLLSSEKATALTKLKWPLNICRSTPVVVSQSQIVPSLDPDVINLPLGEKTTVLTKLK
jgi:hypothetical protein